MPENLKPSRGAMEGRGDEEEEELDVEDQNNPDRRIIEAGNSGTRAAYTHTYRILYNMSKKTDTQAVLYLTRRFTAHSPISPFTVVVSANSVGHHHRDGQTLRKLPYTAMNGAGCLSHK